VQSHTTEAFRRLVHATLPIYAVRIDRDWRALGIVKDATMVWFWIGPHSEYEKLLSKL
jgi:hypothetical protein